MNRRLLAFIVPVLAAASVFAFTQSIATAAPQHQDTPTTVGDASDAVPISPTIRIQLRQQIPLTASLSALLDDTDSVTGTELLTDTSAITTAVVETATAAVTGTAAITGTDTVTESAAADATAVSTDSQSVGADEIVTLLLDLELDFIVSETMTMTVPATLTLLRANGLTDTITGSLPVSLEVGVSPTAQVTVTALAVAPSAEITDEVTDTTAVTLSEAVTVADGISPTTEITTTAPVTSTDPAVDSVVTPTETITESASLETTTATTVNVRAGPGTDFEIVDTLGPGTAVQVEGISEDGLWYLLSSATWLFNTLVENPPTDPPLATAELIETVTQQNAANAQPADTPTEEDADEPTDGATDEPTTEEPTEETPAEDQTDAGSLPTVTVDANLRAGPGTEFEVLGGTVTGQTINIIGQNATNEWYLLDNGGWVFANLVANSPEDIPVVPDDATPESVGTTPETVPAPVLPTPTPQPGADTATDESAGGIVLGLEETLYIDEVNNIANRYETTASTVEQLVADAGADASLFEDTAWQGQMNTAIQVFTQTGEEIRNVDPPPLLAAAHIDFVNAAGSFDQAAALLTQGLDSGDLAPLQQAVAEFQVGRTLLSRGQDQLPA